MADETTALPMAISVNTTAEDASLVGVSLSAEQFYRDNDCTLVALATLCAGMENDDGSPLIDVNAKPWNEYVVKKGVRSLQPTAAMLKSEIKRRWDTFYAAKTAADAALGGAKAEKSPKCKNWMAEKISEWLKLHPIVDEDEVAFLQANVKLRIDTAAKASEDKLLEAQKLQPNVSKGTSGGKAWKGIKPFLRLIHCLVNDDAAKKAYLNRGSLPPGRMKVEQRKTPAAKTASPFQMIANNFNNKEFAPATEAVPHLDPMFETSQTITFDDVAHYLACDAANVEARFNMMLNIMKRNIHKWEKSGQGAGGRKGDDNNDVIINGNEDDATDDISDVVDAADDAADDISDVEDIDSSDSSTESIDSLDTSKLKGELQATNSKLRFGVTAGRGTYALGSRTEFFTKKEKHALYLWHMLEKHGLLGSSMSMLRDGVCSKDGADGIPSAITKRGDWGGAGGADDESIGSKSLHSKDSSIRSKGSSSIGAKSKGNNDGSVISSSIAAYSEKMIQFASMREASKKREQEQYEESKERDRRYEEQKEKRQRVEKLEDAIDKLAAEKRQLIIQCHSEKCEHNAGLRDSIQDAIDDVVTRMKAKESEKLKLQIELEAEVPTPVKMNRSP